MKSRLPILLILALTGMWLLLNSTLAMGHILLGLFVSLVMVFGFRAVRPLQPRLHRPLVALLLLTLIWLVSTSASLAAQRPFRAV